MPDCVNNCILSYCFYDSSGVKCVLAQTQRDYGDNLTRRVSMLTKVHELTFEDNFLHQSTCD